MELIARTVNVYCVSGSRSDMISSSSDASTYRVNTVPFTLAIVSREGVLRRSLKEKEYRVLESVEKSSSKYIL